MQNVNTVPPDRPDRKSPVRFRTYFTTKNGKRIYAKDYGYPCWPIGKSGANRKG